MKKSEIIKLILLLILATCVVTICTVSQSLEGKEGAQHIKSTFKGIIVAKEKKRETFITYRLLGAKEQFELLADRALADHAAIGDTIFKLPNSNRCILTNKNKKLVVDCFWMPAYKLYP